MRRRSSRSSPTNPQFSGRRRRLGRDRWRPSLGVRVIELRANRAQLPVLELADRDPAPAVRRTDHRRVHQLQHWTLPEGVRNDVRSAPLLEEEPLEEVRRPDDLPMAEGEPQMRRARLEVLEETLPERGQLALVGLAEIVAEKGGHRRGGRLVAGPGATGDLRPLALGGFTAE